MKNILLTLLLCGAVAQAQELSTVESLMAKEQYAEAFEVAEKLASNAEDSGDFTAMVKAKSMMVEACLGLGNDAKVDSLLRATTGLFTRMQLNDITYYTNGQALSQISRIYGELGDLDEARLYARGALRFTDPQTQGNLITSRYSMLADLDIKAGNYTEALASLEEGFKHLTPTLSLATLAELKLQKVVCLEGLGKTEGVPDLLDEIEELVHRTSEIQYLNHSTAVFLRLADRALHQQDTVTAMKYADSAVRHADKFQDREEEAVAYRYLEKYYENSDSSLAKHYCAMADSLSYEPYLRKMVGKVAFDNLEFTRREREQKIKIQRMRISLLVSGLVILAIALLLSLLLLRKRELAARLHKEQIASLKKSLEQREKLLAVANAIADPTVRKEMSNAVGGIMGDLPVKLTARELEVARLAAQGLMNKEIAFKLGISTRTVEAHRNNVYRKLEVSNISEMKYYLNAIDHPVDR